MVTPAVSGPYDLGNIVSRIAVEVDQTTAAVTAKSDPLPQVFGGIPLRLRSVLINLDRNDFTLNPTSCNPFDVTGILTGDQGATANPQNYFQVGNCDSLDFEPKLKAVVKGKVGRGGHPALTTTISQDTDGAANLGKAVVTLPHSEFLDQEHIRTICTRVQIRGERLPARLRLRPRDGGDAASRRAARRPGLPEVVLEHAARPGRRPEGTGVAPDPGRARRQDRFAEPADPRHLLGDPGHAGLQVHPADAGGQEGPADQLGKHLQQHAEGQRQVHRPERRLGEADAARSKTLTARRGPAKARQKESREEGWPMRRLKNLALIALTVAGLLAAAGVGSGGLARFVDLQLHLRRRAEHELRQPLRQ